MARPGQVSRVLRRLRALEGEERGQIGEGESASKRVEDWGPGLVGGGVCALCPPQDREVLGLGLSRG